MTSSDDLAGNSETITKKSTAHVIRISNNDWVLKRKGGRGKGMKDYKKSVLVFFPAENDQWARLTAQDWQDAVIANAFCCF